MSGYNPFIIRWNTLSSAGAKSAVLGILIIFCIPNLTNGQTHTPLPENIRLYNQAVTNKEYREAGQYAYEIATYYSEAKASDKAINYLNQSLAYAKRSDNHTLLYAVFHQLGTYDVEHRNYAKALEKFQDALKIGRQLKDATLIREGLINVSICYGYMERYKKSIEHAEEALSLSIAHNDAPLQQKCYQLLAEYYSKHGNKKRAAECQFQYNLLVKARQDEALKTREVKELKQHIEKVGLEKLATESRLQETNDSLRIIGHSLQATTDSLKQIEQISKNRQMEIDLLQKDKELAEAKIKEQETRIQNEALVRNFIIVGTLLSVALIIVLIISYRKKIRANEQIDQQNRNIKSSINYAKRIQEAMLPRKDQYPAVFENSFILFQPRDTVSGDFYWLSDIKTDTQQGPDIAFAAVDCTGHGVPGAFMSMIGINALNGIVNRGVTETNVILDSLDHEIRTALRQEISGNNDGMDAALCIYRQRKKVLEFSGAKSPLVYIQNNSLFQVKGDIHSIGGSKHKNQFFFKKHEIAIDQPTVLYLFSDGYKDQFGGKDNGKFMAKRLNNLLLEIHQLPMDQQRNILQTTLDEWKGIRGQTDDILVMGLKLDPQ